MSRETPALDPGHNHAASRRPCGEHPPPGPTKQTAEPLPWPPTNPLPPPGRRSKRGNISCAALGVDTRPESRALSDWPWWRAQPRVHRTPRISCEAVPPPVLPAGAQGGTSVRSTGAALSFVSCIRLFCGTLRPYRPRRPPARLLGRLRSASLALTSFRTRLAGSGLPGWNLIVPGLVSYAARSAL